MDLNTYKTKAFLSTPNFLHSLTSLGIRLLSIPENKLASLKAGLHQINALLPGSVYIPFVNNGWRNHCVLSIQVDETKLF